MYVSVVLFALLPESVGLSYTAYLRASVAASSPFPPPRARASSETAVDRNSRRLNSELQPHPSPHIGPDTHRLVPDEVELVHQMRDEERADGSNASLATQMEHR